MAAGSSIAPSSWRDAVGVGARAQRHGAGARSSVSPVARLRPQIGSTFTPRRAQQRQPVGLRLGQRALVGEHAVVAGLGERQRADHAAGVARVAVRVGNSIRYA